MNPKKRKKESPDLSSFLYGSLFGGRFPSTLAMSLLSYEYSFHRDLSPGLNLCHCSVHPFYSSLLFLQISDLSLHVLAGFRYSVFFGSCAWPSRQLVPASSASHIGTNLFCVGLGDSQQSARVCQWVYRIPQIVDGAASPAHLKEICRSSSNLSQGLCYCSEQSVTEGQLLTVSFLFRLLGFRSESQVCFLLLFPYPFRAPCCHSLLLGLTIPIAGFVISLTNTLVFCVLIRLKIPSMWLRTINLFWRSSYVCSCSSTVSTRYTILYVLSTIVMSSLHEGLRPWLWYLILRIFSCLYKPRRSFRSVRRHLLNLAKILCLVKLTHRNLKFVILGLQFSYVEYVNHCSVPFSPCCCWDSIMLCADFWLEMLAPLYVYLGLILVVCSTTPFVQCLSFRTSYVIYEEQHVSMCSLCRMYIDIVGQSSKRGWFVLIMMTLGLGFWEDGIAVYAPHGGANGSLVVLYLLCLTLSLLSLLLSSLVLLLSWFCFCVVKPLEFGSQFSQWAENGYLGLILDICSSITFFQSLPLRTSCVTYIAQHVSMYSMYRMYSGMVDHSSKGGWFLLIMMTLSSSLTVLWIKHTLSRGITSLWLSLFMVFEQVTVYMTNGQKAQLRHTAEDYLKPTAA